MDRAPLHLHYLLRELSYGVLGGQEGYSDRSGKQRVVSHCHVTTWKTGYTVCDHPISVINEDFRLRWCESDCREDDVHEFPLMIYGKAVIHRLTRSFEVNWGSASTRSHDSRNRASFCVMVLFTHACAVSSQSAILNFCNIVITLVSADSVSFSFWNEAMSVEEVKWV